MRPRPYESHVPFRRPLRVREETPFLHAARRVRFVGLWRSGVGPLGWMRAQLLSARLRAAVARAAGTWRYRVRIVRWLRADVGFCHAAPLRSLTDHGRRVVLFDWDAMAGVVDLEGHPAVRDEARHIREREAGR